MIQLLRVKLYLLAPQLFLNQPDSVSAIFKNPTFGIFNSMRPRDLGNQTPLINNTSLNPLFLPFLAS